MTWDMSLHSEAKEKQHTGYFFKELAFFTGISAPELLGNGTVGSGTVGKEPLELDPAEERAVFDAIYWNGGSRA